MSKKWNHFKIEHKRSRLVFTTEWQTFIVSIVHFLFSSVWRYFFFYSFFIIILLLFSLLLLLCLLRLKCSFHMSIHIFFFTFIKISWVPDLAHNYECVICTNVYLDRETLSYAHFICVCCEFIFALFKINLSRFEYTNIDILFK